MLPLKTVARKCSSASSFPGGESPPGTGQWPVLPIGTQTPGTKLTIDLAQPGKAISPVLVGELQSHNAFESPGKVVPVTTPFDARKSFGCEMPAQSFTVIRMKTR